TAWVSAQSEKTDAVASAVESAPTAAKADAVNAPKISGEAAGAVDVDLKRPAFPEAKADLFAARSWAPPVVQKPAPPTAPALPYTYFGRMTEDGKQYVFLQRGERSYTAKSGDVLDNQYRVEEITNDAVFITYLPLKQRQVLQTGSGSNYR
ncbi:MAG: hypothetical protein ACM3SS_24865, partial [Rhodospirillaceae bacterium]